MILRGVGDFWKGLKYFENTNMSLNISLTQMNKYVKGLV